MELVVQVGEGLLEVLPYLVEAEGEGLVHPLKEEAWELQVEQGVELEVLKRGGRERERERERERKRERV